MIRTLLGVLLAGTLLLGWCWYYSDHLPQHLQQMGWMESPTAETETVEAVEADEDYVTVHLRQTTSSTVAAGPLHMQLFAKSDETGGYDWRRIGLGFATFLGSAGLIAMLLAMAGLRHYLARVAFVFLLGLLAAVLVQMSQYIFWGQSWEVTAYKSIFFITAALLAGFVLASFIRPQPGLVKIPVRVR